MTSHRLIRIALTLALLTGLTGCNLPSWQNLPSIPGLNPNPEAPSPTGKPLTTALPPPSETLVTFRVQVPPGSPPGEPFYLTLVDEVTGLALNTQPIPMQSFHPEGEASLPQFIITLPFPLGSVVKYRYERQAGGIRVGEHLSDGSAARYRLFHVTGQAVVDDVISRWTDTAYALPKGRIQGQATDAVTGSPIPNLLVSAGGAQTLTTSDGSFMLEGLPPGVHNLVCYALDGSYQTFQQGARVAEGSTTPALFKLDPAAFINVVFVVKPPGGTPPVVPLRLAGNLAQLGNTFADLSGGMSSLAVNMPVLSVLPDGRYTLTAALPVGGDIRYKYTLGDGFWNAEHTQNGATVLRQIIVPDHTVLIEDAVESWFAAATGSITFDLTVPAETPAADYIAIQFNPLFGWTEPVPMWKLGDNHWAYILYSPLNLPGNFSYRYCRNGQCGTTDDVQTPGLFGAGRSASIGDEPQTIRDQVTAWVDWTGGASVVLPPVENVLGRGDGYWAGVQLATNYAPSWDALLPAALEQIHNGGANWVVLTPTWSYGRGAPGNSLPILAPVPGDDAIWSSLSAAITEARSLGLNVAIRPIARFAISRDEWWLTAPRDESWWQVWFEQYRVFVLHHADLAASSGAQTLILGGEWLRPALPGQNLPDGSPSGLPQDAETRWRDLLAEIRSRYNGQLAWAVSYQDVLLPPSFLDLVDRVLLELPVPAGQTIDATLGQSLDTWLDVSAMSMQYLSGKPMILTAVCNSNPDLQAQVDCYQTLLAAANARDWISGFVSLGYYPAAALRDASPSVHGKPAEELLGLWYPEMVK